MVSDYLASIIKHSGIDMTTATLTSSIAWDDFFQSNNAAESPIVFKDDPIALTCASHRLGQQRGFAWLDLHSDSVTVEPQDRDTAADIRKYYADRLLLNPLRFRDQQ